MWERNWREAIWSQLDQPWDIVVIGGGITGAGILREATRLGMRALLVEQRDFAWGTSSRSSKQVHGGLRYIKEGNLRLMHESIQERERLMREGPGLINPLGMLLTLYKGDRPGRWTFKAALSIYDLLAGRWQHRHHSATTMQMLAPHITPEGLEGGFFYGDAQTDDARLVLRVIHEAVADGGLAINYVAARDLLLADGRVVGVRLHDKAQDRVAEVHAQVVINATGVWVDRLRGQVGAAARMRPLRGAHLVFPRWRVPVAQSVGLAHPVDMRPIFIMPWEGATLVGTTDADHRQALDEETGISPAEVAYLMAAVETVFPSLDLTLDDVIAAYAGVRPVIGSGKADPTKESRDHAVWDERGLLTVTGGKLTTFRVIALDALAAVRHRLPNMPPPDEQIPMLNQVSPSLPGAEHLDETARRRLLGRYGADAPALLATAHPRELETIPGTPILWAELRWAARAEGVVHLEDLLLRRVRLGLLLPQGGAALLPTIRVICQPELGWDDTRWETEEAAYLTLWQRYYRLPDPATIPDWHAMVAPARARHQGMRVRVSPQSDMRRRLTRGLASVGFVLALLLVRRRLASNRRSEVHA